MKIRAPDDDIVTENERKSDSQSEVVKKTFQDEIKEILKVPEVPRKFVIQGVKQDSPEYNLQVLVNFTQLCREEILPRHALAAGAIETKLDELQCQQMCQKKELAHITACKSELQKNLKELEIKKIKAQQIQEDLNIRLKEVLKKLQDNCRNKTIAERKMAEDLQIYEKKVTDLKVNLVETKSKMNYYTTQVKAQSDMGRKRVKPLYLDRNRAAFLKENLNSMRLSIEELVTRMKKLKSQASDITEPELCTD